MRGFVSEHRFRLTLALCALALVLMTAGLYATTEMSLTWNAPSVSGR